MSEQLEIRVDELLSAADRASTAALSPDDGESAPSIGDTAAKANELVESTDPQELLAAVGLDRQTETTGPETIPEAVARGDPERVDDLKRLLHLASLADRGDDETLDAAADTLQTAIEATRGGEPAEMDETDETDDSASIADKAVSATDSGSRSDLEDQLRSAVSERVETFSNDVSSLQKQLESIAGGATSDSEATPDADDTGAEGDDEPADGLLGTDLGDDQLGSIGSSDSSRHSTMAPPPSERADMHALRRHSTMPKK